MDDREDLLLHRIVERRARPADWDEMLRLADVDDDVWRRLGETLRADDLLAAAFDAAVPHDGVPHDGVPHDERAGIDRAVGQDDAPTPINGHAFDVDVSAATRAPTRSGVPTRSGWSTLSGWAAALLVAILWWQAPGAPVDTSMGGPGDIAESGSTPVGSSTSSSLATPSLAAGSEQSDPGGGGVASADMAPSGVGTGIATGDPDMLWLTGSPRRTAPSTVLLGASSLDQQAVTAAFQTGPEDPFVSELPAVLLESTRLPGGGLEVVYVRRELHSAIVDRLYSLARDDAGRPTPIPMIADEAHAF